jgi:hypothetical protein
MRIDAIKNVTESAIQTAQIVKGVLYLQHKHVSTQDYLAENKSDKDKMLLIEHPLREQWQLADTPKPVETTETLYRFLQPVPANQTTTLTVKEEFVESQALTILPMETGQLQFYSQSGRIPKSVRDVLAKAISFKSAMVDTQRQIDDCQKQLDEISREQERIRNNMKAVERNSQVYNRWVTKLNEQETQIEKLQSQLGKLRDTLQKQRADLEEYLANITIG